MKVGGCGVSACQGGATFGSWLALCRKDLDQMKCSI